VRIDGFAASIHHGDDRTASRRVSAQIRCIEVAATNDLGKRIEIAVKLAPIGRSRRTLTASVRPISQTPQAGTVHLPGRRTDHASCSPPTGTKALVSGGPFIFAGAMFPVAEHLGEPADHHTAITTA
jgi:hypothetical protein